MGTAAFFGVGSGWSVPGYSGGLSAGAVLPDRGGMLDRAAIPDFDLFPSQNTVVSLPVLLPINYLYRKLYE